jgi:hypothetical protein
VCNYSLAENAIADISYTSNFSHNSPVEGVENTVSYQPISVIYDQGNNKNINIITKEFDKVMKTIKKESLIVLKNIVRSRI